MFKLKSIKAVIFDMDGTMVDNSHFHKKAWIEFCQRKGIDLTEEDYFKKISGKRNDAILKLLLGELDKNKQNELEEEKEKIYRDLYALEIKEVPGLSALIRKLKEKGIKIAIGTTSYQKNRDFVIKSLELDGIFDVIVGSEHIQKGKPDPEIYFKVAQLLKVDPKDCLVFEDTPSGIQAAKAAGMKVVGVLTAHSKEELNQADLLINNFKEFTNFNP